MIKLEGLNKFYNKNKSNELHVINDVNIELPSNGFISFLGASGSGKTTLLNVIGGLDKASGTLSYDSFEMKRYDMKRIDAFRNEHFGYVFQSYNLLVNESVYDNLKLALDLIDIHDPDEVASRIEYALTSVGMYKYRKKKAGQLSGGQQQRVAIARALVKHCKVIIADEPTGNLDSANAVEVMNILKSISKKTLVLLVTHNESLANFYSDRIYRIEDGKIVDEIENESGDPLNTVNDNVVYLKDMTLTEVVTDSVGVKLYSNTDSGIELEIVERNNTYYIRSNKTVKLVESSNLKLVDDHYRPTEKKSDEEYDYDDSFFNNEKSKKGLLAGIFAHLKHSFKLFITPTKKVKAIYTSLALIGVLFAMCAISISNAMKVDTDGIYSDDAYSTFFDRYYDYGVYDDGEILKTSLINGDISSVQMPFYRYVIFAKKLNFVEEKRYQQSYNQMYYNTKVNTLLYGREPEGDEIAVSLGIANDLLAYYGEYVSTYEELFDLVIDTGESRLVGVVDNPGRMVYVSEEAYVEQLAPWISETDNHYRYYDYEKRYDNYEIVAGRDLTDEDKATGNILISEEYDNAESLIGSLIDAGMVVGVYRLKDFKGDPDDVIVHGSPKLNENNEYRYSYSTEEHLIVEGREPVSENECIVSIYSTLAVGDKLNGYDVVGRYNASASALNSGALLSTSALSISIYNTKVFIVEDEEAFLNTVDGLWEVKSMYDSQLDHLINDNNRIMTVYFILGAVCLIAASVLVFFLMRSKMINDIYSIGVYRSLGSSNRKIYAKYFFDTLVMVSFTALISYIFTMFVYITAIRSVNEYLSDGLFATDLTIPLIGVAVLYGLNLFFGLLPIINLLRKTPSEILAKYDI